MTFAINIQENISLAPLTTLKIGGEARFFARVKTEEQILDGLRIAGERGLPVFILGGGSNVLIADEGFDGLVLQIALKGISREGNSLTAAAGEDWDEFVEFCVRNQLAGVECLSGIPGFVGATPIQNVGAYGQDVSETIVSARVLERETSEIKTLTNSDCGFSYRSSIFNTSERGRYIVLAATFALRQNGEPALRYADLQKYFAEKSETPTLAETREAVIKIRAQKSMVISADDPNAKSAGSFFKNPVVSESEYRNIQNIAEGLGLVENGRSVPNFPAPGTDVKIPAAWLIEKAGFPKGYTRGNAGISANHTLAIINRGEAKASDVLALKEEIQDKVREKFGVALTPEPVFIGFKEDPKFG